MHGYNIVMRVYDCLGEAERVSNMEYTHARVVRALNDAMEELVSEMAACQVGLLETSASLSIAVDDLSASLPGDLHQVKRLYDADGSEIEWSGPRRRYPLAGVRLLGDSLEWDVAAAAADTWTLEYVRKPTAFRYGTLATGYDSGVVLPTSDSEGAVSTTDDSYIGESLSFLSGTAVGMMTYVSDYVGSTMKATVLPVLATEPASGDTYMLGEDWLDAWAPVLAKSAAIALAREGDDVFGKPYEFLLSQAKRAAKRARPAVSKKYAYNGNY